MASNGTTPPGPTAGLPDDSHRPRAVSAASVLWIIDGAYFTWGAFYSLSYSPGPGSSTDSGTTVSPIVVGIFGAIGIALLVFAVRMRSGDGSARSKLNGIGAASAIGIVTIPLVIAALVLQNRPRSKAWFGLKIENYVGWVIIDWERPDLCYAKAFADTCREQLDLYVPNLRLVQCGAVSRPGFFVKVPDRESATWSTSVTVPRLQWSCRRSEAEHPYAVLSLSVYFEVSDGGSGIGPQSIRDTSDHGVDDPAYGHRLVSRALFDPADASHSDAVRTWARAEGPTVIFIVDEGGGITYLSHDTAPSAKSMALEELEVAQEELAHLDPPLGDSGSGFDAAARRLSPVGRWK